MPEHETEIHETATGEAAAEPDGWEEPIEDLPRRPRRRLLGKGGNPLALALLGVLLLACGFIGGVLVEKGQTSSGSSSSATGSASGLAARFAALRAGASGAGSSTTGSGGSAGSTGGGFGGSAGAAGFARPTAGTVAYLDGSTLYVTNSEGNTVKVQTSAGTTVTKTVKSTVKHIHPGETVTVTGTTGSNGAITAESISAGASGGGLSALFGSGTGARGGTASARGSGGASGPALFGSGG
jgi:hypothetical protein